jgi:hypothetical protein
MTASVEVVRQAEAPDAVISRDPGEPRPARRQRAAILIVGRAACRGRSCGRGTVTVDSRDAFLSPAAHGISEFFTSR